MSSDEVDMHQFNLVTVAGKVVQLWDLSRSASLGHEIELSSKDISVCSLNEAGNIMLFSDGDSSMQLMAPWGAPAIDAVAPLIKHCSSVSISQCGSYSLVGNKEGQVHKFSLQNGVLVKKYAPGHASGTAVTSISHSNMDRNKVASVSKSGSLLIHHFHSGRKSDFIIDPKAQALSSVSFSPHSRQEILTGGELGLVRLWTLPSKVDYFWQTRCGGSITATAFDVNDENRIFSTSLDKHMSLIDKRSNRIQQTIYLGRPLYSLAFRKESSEMAVGDGGGGIHIYDLRTTTPRLQFQTISMDGHPINKPIRFVFWRDILLSTQGPPEDPVTSPQTDGKGIGKADAEVDQMRVSFVGTDKRFAVKNIVDKFERITSFESQAGNDNDKDSSEAETSQKDGSVSSPRSPLQISSGHKAALNSGSDRSSGSRKGSGPSWRKRKSTGRTRFALFSGSGVSSPLSGISNKEGGATASEQQKIIPGKQESFEFRFGQQPVPVKDPEPATVNTGNSNSTSHPFPKLQKAGPQPSQEEEASSTSKKVQSEKQLPHLPAASKEMDQELQWKLKRARLKADGEQTSSSHLSSSSPMNGGEATLPNSAAPVADQSESSPLKPAASNSYSATPALSEQAPVPELEGCQTLHGSHTCSESPSREAVAASADMPPGSGLSVSQSIVRQESLDSQGQAESSTPALPMPHNDLFEGGSSCTPQFKHRPQVGSPEALPASIKDELGSMQASMQDVARDMAEVKAQFQQGDASVLVQLAKMDGLLESIDGSVKMSMDTMEKRFQDIEKNQKILDFNVKYLASQLKTMALRR